MSDTSSEDGWVLSKVLVQAARKGDAPDEAQAITPGGPSSRSTWLRETGHTLKRMMSIVAQKGETETKAEVRRMYEMVFSLRKEFDTLHVSSALPLPTNQCHLPRLCVC